MKSEQTSISMLESKIDRLESMISKVVQGLEDKGIAINDSISSGSQNKESNLSKVERDKIHDIMANFDFDKVHGIMEMLDWKWALSRRGVPTVDELKTEAYRLLVDAALEKTNVATGGFRAVYEECGQGDPDPYIGLEFIVEECEGFFEED